MKKKKNIIVRRELTQEELEKLNRINRMRSIDPDTGKKRQVVFHRASGRGGYYDYE